MGTISSDSFELNRCTNDLPVRIERNVAWTKARRLPGVRCWVSRTIQMSPLNLMACPFPISLALGIKGDVAPGLMRRSDEPSKISLGDKGFPAKACRWRLSEQLHFREVLCVDEADGVV